jgi:hypothetical protein
MSINVYWSCLEDQWMLASEPESVSDLFYKKNLYDKKNQMANLSYCPAFNGSIKNLYTMKSIYDYEFFINENSIGSNMYDQFFFDKHVVVRSAELKMFSFRNSYSFFTDSPSLETTFYQFPFLENNNITERCIPIPGKFDIGKWYRSTEFPFYLKPQFNEFKIYKDEIYGYIKFNTDKKINFIQYRMTNKIKEYLDDCYCMNFGGHLKKLENYYKMFKIKKLILKEIKNNLTD